MNDFLVIKQRVGKYKMKKKKKDSNLKRENHKKKKRKRKDKWRRRQLEKISLKSKIYVLMCIIVGIN